MIAPDLHRCQGASKEAHGPFVLGPKPRWVRCRKTARWIAIETVASEDGQRGAMALCGGCKSLMLKGIKDGKSYTPAGMIAANLKFMQVEPFLAAERIGGHEAVAAIFAEEGLLGPWLVEPLIVDSGVTRSSWAHKG